MAANARYEQAPQRDSFEEGQYTQPPPAYHDEAEVPGEMPGTPRNEDDNVPDDFKVWVICAILEDRY